MSNLIIGLPKPILCSLKHSQPVISRHFGFCFLLALIPARLLAEGNPLATIPINSGHSRVMIEAQVNESKPLSFLLDTGYGIDTINPDLIESLGLRRAGRLTIVGIAGEEKAATYAGAVFNLGGVSYAPRRVASLASEGERRWRRRDGILGADFFRHFVVEIDSVKKTVRLFSPTNFTYTGQGQIIPVHFIQDTPIIDATVLSPKLTIVCGRFEVDTGCDDAICLSHDFVATNNLASVSSDETVGMKHGVGGGASVRHGQLPQLQIGQLKLDQPSVSFFNEGSPAANGLAGHIGMAALKNWKIIFDYSRNRMILE